MCNIVAKRKVIDEGHLHLSARLGLRRKGCFDNINVFLTRETPNLSRKRVFHGKRYEHIAAKDFEITSHKNAAIFRAHRTVFPL